MAALPLAGDVEQFPSLHHVAVPAQPTAGLEAALSAFVPEARLASIRRQRQPIDRLVRLLGSALLHGAAASEGLGWDPSVILYPDNDAPQWPGGPTCSVSHCSRFVVLLLGLDSPVGVDIEAPDAVVPQDLRLALPPGLLAPVADGRVAAADAWMRVEAALKTFRVGLRGLADLRFEDLDTAVWRGQRAYLQPAMVEADLVCWCSQTRRWSGQPVRTTRHELDELLGLLAAVQPRRIPAL